MGLWYAVLIVAISLLLGTACTVAFAHFANARDLWGAIIEPLDVVERAREAQPDEQGTSNPEVAGSTPVAGTTKGQP